ncbi:MAG TPA: FecR domain-containing protein [Puia sp.]|jgi:ferric-dicitrate binding protein FerR (iron transport regulator)
MIPSELVNRFLRNECTAEEHAYVLDYFRQHPGEWDAFISEEEWQQIGNAGEETEIPSGKMHRRIDYKTRVRPKRMRVAMTASAFVALVAVSLVFFRSEPAMTGRTTTPESRIIAGLIQKQTINNTGKTMVLTLSDGSVIDLAPNSLVRYSDPLITQGRKTVYLTGKARFNVTREAATPFTVVSGELNTTVLGTLFTVSAFPGTEEESVGVEEGKVAVRTSDSVDRKTGGERILNPGDELVYNRKTHVTLVLHNNVDRRGQLVRTTYRKNDAAAAIAPDWYGFEGEALSQVLEQLSTYFQTDIYYYPAELRNKFFTGKLDKKDSLEPILNDIALLNNLIVKKEKGAYYLILRSK